MQGVINLTMTDSLSIFRSAGDVCTNAVNSSVATDMPMAVAAYDLPT